MQLSAATTGLMGKMTAVTGWRIPEGDGTEDYQKVFNDQLTKFIYEQFGDFTLPELEYAVRKYGVDMSDWGKPMHLGLLSACLTSYRAYRETISEIEQYNGKYPLISQKHTKTDELPPGPLDWSQEWSRVVYAAKIGQIRNTWITTDLYDWLIREGKISVPDKNDKPAYEEHKADMWGVIKQCAAVYLEEIKDALISGAGIEPPYEIKRRIALLENKQAPIWKKDTVIMSTLTVMAKKELVRQIAISESLNETE